MCVCLFVPYLLRGPLTDLCQTWWVYVGRPPICPLRGSFSKRSMGRRVNGSLSLSTILYMRQPHATQLQNKAPFALLLQSLIRRLLLHYISTGNCLVILMVKSYIMKCKYENIMPSPEAMGKMFTYKVSLLTQVRNIDLWLLLKLMFQN